MADSASCWSLSSSVFRGLLRGKGLLSTRSTAFAMVKYTAPRWKPKLAAISGAFAPDRYARRISLRSAGVSSRRNVLGGLFGGIMTVMMMELVLTFRK